MLVAVGNSKISEVPPILSKLLFDPEPIVRSMAVWALGQIGDKKVIQASYEALFLKEQDEVVQSEWARIVERLHP